jgi:hypothetical protein
LLQPGVYIVSVRATAADGLQRLAAVEDILTLRVDPIPELRTMSNDVGFFELTGTWDCRVSDGAS